MLNWIEWLAVSSLGIQTGIQNDTNWNIKKRVQFPEKNLALEFGPGGCVK